jgi:hypothetical protein
VREYEMPVQVTLRFAAVSYPEALCRARKFGMLFERVADRWSKRGVEVEVRPIRLPRLVFDGNKSRGPVRASVQ